MKRILIIQGHPAARSLCGGLADAYENAARNAGHTVERLDLGALSFDPILRAGFGGGQPLEPDLQKAQKSIAAAEHLVFVYPNWWGGFPALLKGFFDRAFLPGFAFQYRKDSPMSEKLLKGKTAHAIVTMDTPPWFYRIFLRQLGLRQLRVNILGFCGVKLTGGTLFGPVRGASAEKIAGWLQQAAALGARGE